MRAVLIPKCVGARSLDQFRGIACLVTAGKLMGYLWMKMLPDLRHDSFQTGFVPGAQAADGMFVIKRVSELSRDKELYMVQLDLAKAFDKSSTQP